MRLTLFASVLAWAAAIGNMMWNWRMLAATGNAKFTDVIERALYNGINSGMSLDGVHPALGVHKLLANDIIAVINTKYGTSLAPVP